MTFKANTTAIMWAILAVVYGGYFLYLVAEAQTTPVADIAYQPLLFGVVLVQVVLFTIGVAIVAARAPSEADESDERDQYIEQRGGQIASYVLTFGVLGGLGLAMLEAPWFWIAQVLLAGLVLSELAKGAVMIRAYRRGF